MSWLELVCEIDRRALDLASAALFEQACAGLQEEELQAARPRQPWEPAAAEAVGGALRVRAWFQDPDRAAVESALRAALGDGLRSLAWAAAPDVPWEEAWKEAHEPLRVEAGGVELVIAPPWSPLPGAILLEPGQGFGTGQHPSTRAALRALLLLHREARTALDVGTGSGILALAAARLGLSVRGIDVEPEAIADARENARRNAVSIEVSTTPLDALTEPADLLLANLHAEALVELAPDLRRLAGRHLVLAGILADREAKVRAVFDRWGPLRWRELDGRWVALAYSR